MNFSLPLLVMIMHVSLILSAGFSSNQETEQYQYKTGGAKKRYEIIKKAHN